MINSKAIIALTGIASASNSDYTRQAIHQWISKYVKQYNLQYCLDPKDKDYEKMFRHNSQRRLIDEIINEHEATEEYLMYSTGAKEAGTKFTTITIMVLR